MVSLILGLSDLGERDSSSVEHYSFFLFLHLDNLFLSNNEALIGLGVPCLPTIIFLGIVF
jgi:hypothetical protein